jgi:hypothetical protein
MNATEMRAALDKKMNPALVAYRNEVTRIGSKVRHEEPLSEGERGFVAAILEDCAESTFNTAHFWLKHMAEP